MPPTGLNKVLSGDSSDKFVLIVADDEPCVAQVPLLLRKYISEPKRSGLTTKIHLLAFSHDLSSFVADLNKNGNGSSVVLYDYLKVQFPGISTLFKSIITPTRTNLNSNLSVQNILVIDSIQLFSIYCEKDFGRVILFFRQLLQNQINVFGILNESSTPAREKEYFLKQTEVLVRLIKGNDGAGAGDGHFLCDILRFGGNGGKIHRERTKYQIINQAQEGETGNVQIFESPISLSGAGEIPHPQSAESALQNLTTFKLTLEEDEKESRRRLHLPYFNAQTSSLHETDSQGSNGQDFDFEYEDDEEDEEV